jgi:hypothetical protein
MSDLWEPERLAAACDSIQDQWRRGIELGNGDPRNAYVADVIAAGRRVLEDIYSLASDAQGVVWVLDELPPDVLRLLAFERLWTEGRAREREA